MQIHSEYTIISLLLCSVLVGSVLRLHFTFKAYLTFRLAKEVVNLTYRVSFSCITNYTTAMVDICSRKTGVVCVVVSCLSRLKLQTKLFIVTANADLLIALFR